MRRQHMHPAQNMKRDEGSTHKSREQKSKKKKKGKILRNEGYQSWMVHNLKVNPHYCKHSRSKVGVGQFGVCTIVIQQTVVSVDADPLEVTVTHDTKGECLDP